MDLMHIKKQQAGKKILYSYCSLEFLCFLNEAIQKRLAELECNYREIKYSGWLLSEGEWTEITKRNLETGVIIN